MRTAQTYPESTLFAVPLRDGTYAIGLVARRLPRGKMLFGYFFGARFPEVPKLSELPHFDASHAIERCRCGDLGLFDGSWPVIGQIRPWKRENWPMPLFYRNEDKYVRTADPLTTRLFLIKRSDDDVSEIVWERRVATVPPDTLEDFLAGSGSVERYLRELLDRQVLH